MDATTLHALTDYTRARLLATLDAIEKSGRPVDAVLSWRPAPGRAHAAWQALHCAATHDKYVNRIILSGTDADAHLVRNYGGGSTPADNDPHTLADIRAALARHIEPIFNLLKNGQDLSRTFTLPNGQTRSVGEAVMFLAWHEAHHQGQIHLTWNLYQQAHGLK
jgi:hypothetical protein